MRTAAAALLLAACSPPALPDRFRVDAEIVSVEPGPGMPPTAARFCTPTTEDVDPDGPDWRLEFSRVHDPDEPTFREWTTSYSGDTAERCQAAGRSDCCRPLVALGDKWMLDCDGEMSRFAFSIGDGSGESESTVVRSDGVTVCVARARWSRIIVDE